MIARTIAKITETAVLISINAYGNLSNSANQNA
jgi:hypothetical protein